MSEQAEQLALGAEERHTHPGNQPCELWHQVGELFKAYMREQGAKPRSEAAIRRARDAWKEGSARAREICPQGAPTSKGSTTRK